MMPNYKKSKKGNLRKEIYNGRKSIKRKSKKGNR